MWPATAWDDQDWDDGSIRARGWTVMGRVRARQRGLIDARSAAERRIRQSAGVWQMMTPAVIEQQYRDQLAAKWRGTYAVLAFLFAMPDEAALRTLDRRGDYFDIRTGPTWDLFFPGYFKGKDHYLEAKMGSKPVGQNAARDWFFDPHAFDQLRQHIASASAGSWEYSGGADLVLLNVFVPDDGSPVIDWQSLQFGSLTADGDRSLQAVIERISSDLESGREDASYGVGTVTHPSALRSGNAARDVMVGAAGEIAAVLAAKLFGLTP